MNPSPIQGTATVFRTCNHNPKRDSVIGWEEGGGEPLHSKGIAALVGSLLAGACITATQEASAIRHEARRWWSVAHPCGIAVKQIEPGYQAQAIKYALNQNNRVLSSKIVTGPSLTNSTCISA